MPLITDLTMAFKDHGLAAEVSLFVSKNVKFLRKFRILQHYWSGQNTKILTERFVMIANQFDSIEVLCLTQTCLSVEGTLNGTLYNDTKKCDLNNKTTQYFSQNIPSQTNMIGDIVLQQFHSKCTKLCELTCDMTYFSLVLSHTFNIINNVTKLDFSDNMAFNFMKLTENCHNLAELTIQCATSTDVNFESIFVNNLSISLVHLMHCSPEVMNSCLIGMSKHSQKLTKLHITPSKQSADKDCVIEVFKACRYLMELRYNIRSGVVDGRAEIVCAAKRYCKYLELFDV
jgi:hypothetical protein